MFTPESTSGKLIMIQIAFLHVKRQKLENCHIHASTLVYNPVLATVVNYLQSPYALSHYDHLLRVNEVPLKEKHAHDLLCVGYAKVDNNAV